MYEPLSPINTSINKYEIQKGRESEEREGTGGGGEVEWLNNLPRATELLN